MNVVIQGNVTVPQYSYSTLSFYGEKRKASVGITTFPFYVQFKNQIGFMARFTSVFDKDFRNSRGNAFVVNGGVRLQASDTFSTQLVYIDYEQILLMMEFQF